MSRRLCNKRDGADRSDEGVVFLSSAVSEEALDQLTAADVSFCRMKTRLSCGAVFLSSQTSSEPPPTTSKAAGTRW